LGVGGLNGAICGSLGGGALSRVTLASAGLSCSIRFRSRYHRLWILTCYFIIFLWSHVSDQISVYVSVNVFIVLIDLKKTHSQLSLNCPPSVLSFFYFQMVRPNY